ncbi:MAG TPA: hypothetical protein VH680_14115 [Gemmatimonadales bacterium]|jgi:hypothetical protein
MDQPDLTESLRRLYTRRVSERPAPSACVSPEQILAVIQREGSEAERMGTLEHVMSCAACHREYQWLTAVDQAGTEANATERRTAWWRGRPLALAASLLAVVAAGLLVQGRIRTSTEPVRGLSGHIVLISPEITPAPGDLTFVWRRAAGASGYVLEVQRLDGAIAYSDTTRDTLLTLGAVDQVLPGEEYRWWVRELTDGAEPRSSEFRRLHFFHK